MKSFLSAAILVMIVAALTCFPVSTAVAQKNKKQTSISSRGQLSAIEIAHRILPSVVLIVCDNGREVGKRKTGRI